MSEDYQDRVFAGPGAPSGDFVFDERVARVFPDMLARSVPGWLELVRLVGLTAARFAVPGTRIIDLGCSVGASSASILARLPRSETGAQARVLAVDKAPAMLESLRQRLGAEIDAGRLEAVCADALDVAVDGASVVVLNLTLQFIDPGRRIELLRRIRAGLLPQGALIVAEKIAWDDPKTDELMAQLHASFKQTQGYSALEIARKRVALERVLLPETSAVHEQRLRAAGFLRIERFFQCLNFVGWIAWGAR